MLWGEDLYTKLSDIYQKKGSLLYRIPLEVLCRPKYGLKHELQSAQARVLSEQSAYLLPIRLDDTEIPGILPTIAYLDWNRENPEIIADSHRKKIEGISEEISVFAKKVKQGSCI